MTDRLQRAQSRITGLLEAVFQGALRGVTSRWNDLLEARQLCSWRGLQRIGELPGLIQQLHRHGGVRVVTPDAPDRPLASTLVTPGGDVVSRVSPELFAQPVHWQRHLQAMRQELAPLRQVPALLRSLTSLVAAGLAIAGGYAAWSMTAAVGGGQAELLARGAELLEQLKWPAIGGSVVGGVRYGLGWWLQAQIKNALA